MVEWHANTDWFKNKFVPTNHSRLKTSYEKCKQFFEDIGFRTTKCSAGFFILVDFSSLFNPPSETSSKGHFINIVQIVFRVRQVEFNPCLIFAAFILKLYSHKVYLTPSWDISAPDGWFRFVFTGYDQIGIDTGMHPNTL